MFGLRGIVFRSERGTKGRHTPPQSPNDDLEQRGQTTMEQRARSPEHQQLPANGELMYLRK